MKCILIFALVALTCCPMFAAPHAADESDPFLHTISLWQYPNSTLSATRSRDGALIDRDGNRTNPSIVIQTVMATDASVEKVLDYYKLKLLTQSKDGEKPGAGPAPGRSVVFNDDSEGRPFAMHTILVNEKNLSTTLIITRGKDEGTTFIAWKQYLCFRP